MAWHHRIGNSFQRRRLRRDIDREMSFHLAERAEEFEDGGMSREEAARLARRLFGNFSLQKERTHDMNVSAILETILRNLRLAIRALAKAPGFTTAVVLTLALGIGANSAVFSAIDAVLLRPLPFPQGDQLMHLEQHNPKNPNTYVAPVRLEDWNRMNSTFQAISGYYTEDDSETTGVLPERVTRALVAPRFLQVWGVSPQLGRGFSQQEEHFGGPNAVLITDRFWRRRFNADPNAVGKTLRLNQYSYTIVGVLPVSFELAERGAVSSTSAFEATRALVPADIWSPNWADAPYAQSRDSTWFIVLGRLKPGVTIEQARADLGIVQTRLGEQFPKTDAQLSVPIQPLKEATVGGVRPSLWILFGSVSLLLLIACANIAALLLARSTQRRHEISIRYSLGASRLAVAGQLLTEVFALALAGAAAGLLLALGASKVFRTLAGNLPRVGEIRLDGRVVLFSLACAIAVTVLCGVLPAVRGTRRDVSGSLMNASRTQVSGRHPLQWLLVAVQIALAVTLLSGAGLLVRSLQELGRVHPGFETAHILTFRISGSWGETTNMNAVVRRVNRTLDFLGAIPGVEAAASSGSFPGVPFEYEVELKPMEGRAESEGKMTATTLFVSSGYFQTMRIPILQGEFCEPTNDATPLVMVNRTFANTYYGESSPIGHVFQPSGFYMPKASRIAGIVEDARESGIDRVPGPAVYWCSSATNAVPVYLIRTHGDPAAMTETIRRKIREIEPNRSVFEIVPLQERLDSAFSENRLRTVLLSSFAITAVLLACVGLYGVLSYLVTLRRREVGLRLALGAMRRRIVAGFLAQGLGVSFLGCAVGLGIAAALRRLLAGMLYGVSPSDAPTLSGVVLIVLTVAAVASIVPAIRAARVDPMQVLRDE
jgi:putative ABC transport system permease protein